MREGFFQEALLDQGATGKCIYLHVVQNLKTGGNDSDCALTIYEDERITLPAAHSIMAGNPIHKASLASTRTPQELKKLPTPIGDTWMGLLGKNRRSSLNGHHKAQPIPPVVSMSSKGCEAVASTSQQAIFHQSLSFP